MGEAIRALNAMPLAGLMLVVALGYTLGRVAWRGLSLGPAGGTLVVALLLGAQGLDLGGLYGGGRPLLTVGGFGFALFIYSVGFEAGPHFFSCFLGGPGWRWVLVGSVVNVLAVAVAVLLGGVLALGDSLTAGLLAGALTSAPTYAAAAEVCSDAAALAVAFALTYPIGLVALVLLIQFLPRLTGSDLAADAEEEEPSPRGARPTAELTRAFEVRNPEVFGRTLRDLDLRECTGCNVTRLLREHEVSVPDASTCLEGGDHVLVTGRLDELEAFERLVGPEVYDEELRSRMPAPRRILVLRREVLGRTLREVDVARRFHCLVVGIERGRVGLEPSGDARLERADVVEAVGRRGDLRALATHLGRFERPTHETDIAVYAGGIFLGLLLGRVSLVGFGLQFTLGTAGGLLLAGVLLGRFQNVGVFSASVPAPARQLVRDLGILLFVAETGVVAGGSPLGGLRGDVAPLLAAGVAVTVLPVLGALFVACGLLRMPPLHAWGSVSGGMTSSAALLAVKRAADSNEPAVSYAASYAVASVLVTVAGQVVVALMR